MTTLDLKTPGAQPVQPVCDLLQMLGRTDDVYIGTESRDQPELSQPSFIGRDGQQRITEELVSFSQASDTAVFTWVIDDPARLPTARGTRPRDRG